MNIKVLATSLLASVAFSSVAQADLANCHQENAVCVGKKLIRQLNQESGGAVKARRLIRKMQNQCDTYNARCAGRFVKRAINQAFNGGGGYDPYPPNPPGGSQYKVTRDEITNDNYKRTAWCDPGDRALAGNGPGYYNKQWAAHNKIVVRGSGRRKQEGYECNNHRKNVQRYRAEVTCQRRY